MEEFMNKPIEHIHTDEDIIATYDETRSVKATAKIWCVSSAEVRKIIKSAGR
ncbi:hypothetical protein [Extibacter muris]|uniref:hypothetical protein n=1 Tax=Extibacter muris TaxID=1796622 RepID=UPI0021CADCD7|nr:hypothetical protein [Extibacter muris]MCU0077988.1 hypothetical protein [Extibacter muris]